MEKNKPRVLRPGDACRRVAEREEGMETRTKSAERSAANPDSAKRYRIFAPFCGSGKRAEKNGRSREKIGRRSVGRQQRVRVQSEVGGKPRSDGDKNCM